MLLAAGPGPPYLQSGDLLLLGFHSWERVSVCGGYHDVKCLFKVNKDATDVFTLIKQTTNMFSKANDSMISGVIIPKAKLE